MKTCSGVKRMTFMYINLFFIFPIYHEIMICVRSLFCLCSSFVIFCHFWAFWLLHSNLYLSCELDYLELKFSYYLLIIDVSLLQTLGYQLLVPSSSKYIITIYFRRLVYYDLTCGSAKYGPVIGISVCSACCFIIQYLSY